MHYYYKERLILDWADARMITGENAQATPFSQFIKLQQEYGEWLRDNSKDDIGDCVVCLVNMLSLLGSSVGSVKQGYAEASPQDVEAFIDMFMDQFHSNTPFINAAYGFLEQTFLNLFEGENVAQNDVNNSLMLFIEALERTAKEQGWTIEECIDVAYNDIKDRTGTMVHGMFIKQKDLDSMKELGLTVELCLDKGICVRGYALNTFQRKIMEDELERIGFTWYTEPDIIAGKYWTLYTDGVK